MVAQENIQTFWVVPIIGAEVAQAQDIQYMEVQEERAEAVRVLQMNM